MLSCSLADRNFESSPDLVKREHSTARPDGFIGEIVSYPHQAELTADKHQRVPPIGIFVAVAKLESADSACREKLASLFQSHAGAFMNMTLRNKLGNYFRDLCAQFNIPEQLVQFFVRQEFCVE